MDNFDLLKFHLLLGIFHIFRTFPKNFVLPHTSCVQSLVSAVRSQEAAKMDRAEHLFLCQNLHSNTKKMGFVLSFKSLKVTICGNNVQCNILCLSVHHYMQGSLVPAHAHTMCAGNLSRLTGN